MSERYPCLYGLRENCEAIEFAFRILTGEIKKTVDLIMGIEAGEPKTDEEKFVKKMYEAMAKYMPKFIVQPSGGAELELTRIIEGFCQLCPHRLNKTHEYEAAPRYAHSPPPSPTQSGYFSRSRG